ncbi:hypothetical protein NUU61_002545 [Penicillium alfredii]|uniref:EDC4-like protein pdc1 beta-propeller domain-containing protein n=1 Tax=Penicillium alfredii TaxID=1506179 RepID=A0A9W9FRX3_9EURO|nr:uncharacterized protein NUU61_002545 [Penicillium alfredii]KAJ5105198.1 hypothetical protein NUU61_002545 [Penicillium alfredii]
MSTPNDLQALLASIRPRPSPSNSSGPDNLQPRQPHYQPGLFPPHPQQPYDGQSLPHPQLHGYHNPSVSTIQSPSPVNTPPHHGSDILSPNIPTPRGDWPQQPQSNNPDRATDLLNLLRFSQGSAAPSHAPAPTPTAGLEQLRSPLGSEAATSHGRNISASNLVSSLFGQPAPAAPRRRRRENTQEMLLRLLNRSQPGPAVVETPALVATGQTSRATVDKSQDNGADEAPLEVLEKGSEEPAKLETVAPSTSKDSMFTYVNPFDQLAAISPRNKSPQSKSGSASPAVELTKKQKVNVSANLEQTPTPAPAETQQRSKSPILEDGQRDAVNQVVGRLVNEIGRSLSESESKSTADAKAAAPTAEESSEAVLSSIASHSRDTAAEAQEVAAPNQPKEPFKEEVVDATAAVPAQSGAVHAEALVDSWESAEDSAEKEEERIVSVQNFPLRPFISIAVKPQTGKFLAFRDDGVMDIARLKKEFDQLDRSLTAATSEYIVYALAKVGGIRIIRQDDGSDRQVFRSTRDRVFNVTLCTSSSTSGASEVQAILGIGISGAVYWALISRPEKDLFDTDALESETLIFPPFPASDENTSGGQLKTRAKRSARHPELFAIGRGKNIYVVSPQAAMSPSFGVSVSQRTVNTEKFFKERALKISTGKAGKDFAFSDDDTVIASLDKTGRLRFWDIRDVLDDPSFIEGPAPSEVRIPLNTFVTGSPTEKSWPTSVLFLDKLRAYSKSMALRYVLVGLKQNHTLQLWDIGLGKAVQELKFPHENESDAICSVAYHPASGIIVVGHPTRNSIYFVHLSAPKYNLPQMSQAAFIRAASEKDSNLPKPESTACLSGIREISLGSKGELRSLELLPINKSATEKRGSEDTALFELYVMHSRGVTCLNINKEDLGWTPENKVIRPVDALGAGFIEINELQSFPSYVTDDPSVNGDAASIPSRATIKEPVKKADIGDSGAVPSRNTSPIKPSKKKGDESVEAVSTSNGSEKPEKKKKKKAAAEAAAKVKEPTATTGVEPLSTPATQAKEQPENETLASSAAAMSATHATGHALSAGLIPGPPGAGISNEALNKHLESLQNSVSGEFNKSLGREIEALYRRFDEDRRNWDAASAAKQDQVLRLVSSTLSDNVEKNLARIVSSSIQTDVVPAITDATSSTVNKQLGSVLDDELRQSLPKAVTHALQHPAVMKAVSDSVAQKLAPRIEIELSKTVQSSIAPMIENLTRSTKKVEADLEQKFQAQIKHYEAQRQSNNAKIEEMSALLRGLSNTVSSLAANQGRQSESSIPQRPSAGRPSETTARVPQAPAPQTAPATPPVSRTAEEAELADIARTINAGQFEEGTIKWLQSNQQADLFDNFFVRVSPNYLARLSAILTLSVGVAVTSSLQTNIIQRLGWLDVVLHNVDARDSDLREVAPRIMEVLTQRLNTLYMTVAERNPHDPILRLIAPLSRRARELHGF